jgi:hypothetical protein
MAAPAEQHASKTSTRTATSQRCDEWRSFPGIGSMQTFYLPNRGYGVLCYSPVYLNSEKASLARFDAKSEIRPYGGCVARTQLLLTLSWSSWRETEDNGQPW